MTAADRPEFAAALAPLFAAYGKPMSEDQADAYWRFLSDLPIGVVLDGIEAAGRKAGRYLPSVGQIREAIDGQAATRDTRPRIECDLCEGAGWRWVAPRLVAPCVCEAGRVKRDTRRAVA